MTASARSSSAPSSPRVVSRDRSSSGKHVRLSGALRRSLEAHLAARLDLSAVLDDRRLDNDTDPRTQSLVRILRDERRHRGLLEDLLGSANGPARRRQSLKCRMSRSGVRSRHSTFGGKSGSGKSPSGPRLAFLNGLWHGFGLHEQWIGLILPKIIARVCFNHWTEHAGDPCLRKVSAGIARDLDRHLSVYTEKLTEDMALQPSWRRISLRWLGSALFHLTAAVMFFHHAAALHDHGLTCARFLSLCRAEYFRCMGQVAAFEDDEVLALQSTRS